MLRWQHQAQAAPLPESLVTGNSAIDHEHALLLDQLDNLRAARDLSTRDEAVGEALNNISQLLLSHFAHEEAFMRNSPMPEGAFADHLDAHLAIIEEMCNLQTLMMKAPVMVAEVLTTIETWIVAHIRDFDLQIKRYD